MNGSPPDRQPLTGRIQSVVLPEGGPPRTLYVVDGRITATPVPDAVDLCPPGGFVLPGLCDAHVHVDFPQEELAPGGRESFVRRNLVELAGAGTLVARDLGASARTLESLAHRPGEPRMVSAGECAIGCENHCFPPTAPQDLVASAVAQIRPGVGWVKVFTDWPDPAVEDHTKSTYFGANNPLTYSPELLAELVVAVHAVGGKVASHAFTQAGCRASVQAGVDSIEHGWGIGVDLLPAMAARGIAWVPLLGIGPPMKEMSLRDGRPDQAAWVDACLVAMRQTLSAAVAAGVPVLTGTDWFPVVTLAHEAAMLHQLGLDPSQALAAASTAGRRFLGLPCLEEGAPADLVHYARDPRVDLSCLVRPDLILVQGVSVRPEVPAEPTPPEERLRRDEAGHPVAASPPALH